MASYQQQAAEDVKTIREWAQEVILERPELDESEVLADAFSAYIDTEIGDSDPQRVKEISRRLGL